MDTKALRQKILDLAIRGKLVPQDPNDEPASVLLERIRAEKQQMVKDGKLKAKDLKNDSVIFVGDDNLHYEKFSDGTIKCLKKEIPFKIPSTWTWVRLGFIGNWGAGATPNRAHSEYYGGDIPWLKTGDLNDDYITEIPETITELALKETSVKLNPVGSILIAMYGATIGKLGILTKQATTNQACCACCPVEGVYNKYLFYFLMSHKTKFINRGIGGAQPNISKEKIVATLMPLPPIDEQLRIVSSIESFFFNIERIVNEQLNISELVVKTKSKILDLAIRGKLVPQNPDDEPATMLLARIRREKEELIKAGKLKRDKRESVIFRGEDNSYYETIGNKRACIDSEIHYDIPEGWTVERLKNLYSVNPKNDIANDETIVSFVPMNLINDRFLYNCTYELKQWKDCKKGFTHFADGDLGFAKISPCFENRKSVVFSNLKNGYGAGTTELYILRNFCEGLNPEYAILFLKSESFIERGVDTYSGTVGQQRIDKNIMMDTIIPIPPQNEQQRIADRVKQLFSILDSIQATIV